MVACTRLVEESEVKWQGNRCGLKLLPLLLWMWGTGLISSTWLRSRCPEEADSGITEVHVGAVYG